MSNEQQKKWEAVARLHAEKEFPITEDSVFQGLKQDGYVKGYIAALSAQSKDAEEKIEWEPISTKDQRIAELESQLQHEQKKTETVQGHVDGLWETIEEKDKKIAELEALQEWKETKSIINQGLVEYIKVLKSCNSNAIKKIVKELENKKLLEGQMAELTAQLQRAKSEAWNDGYGSGFNHGLGNITLEQCNEDKAAYIGQSVNTLTEEQIKWAIENLNKEPEHKSVLTPKQEFLQMNTPIGNTEEDNDDYGTRITSDEELIQAAITQANKELRDRDNKIEELTAQLQDKELQLQAQNDNVEILLYQKAQLTAQIQTAKSQTWDAAEARFNYLLHFYSKPNSNPPPDKAAYIGQSVNEDDFVQKHLQRINERNTMYQLLNKLEQKDKALSGSYDLQHQFRQGFFLAHEIVRKYFQSVNTLTEE